MKLHRTTRPMTELQRQAWCQPWLTDAIARRAKTISPRAGWHVGLSLNH